MALTRTPYPPIHLSWPAARHVGVVARADPRTAIRFAAGEPVRGHVAERIADALRILGYVDAPAAPAKPAHDATEVRHG